MSAPSRPDPDRPRVIDKKRWLWDHIGRITGTLIGLLAVGVIAFLAAIGFRPALYFLVVIVVGIALIILGGKIKGT